MGLPTVSSTLDEGASHFVRPFMATAYGFDGPASSSYTQELLGRSPTHPTLFEDLEHGDYLAMLNSCPPYERAEGALPLTGRSPDAERADYVGSPRARCSPNSLSHSMTKVDIVRMNSLVSP